MFDTILERCDAGQFGVLETLQYRQISYQRYSGSLLQAWLYLETIISAHPELPPGKAL
jgi:hypothetical protein